LSIVLLKAGKSMALILLGHGSHISSNTAGIVWQQVDRLRALGVDDEVTAAFWKELPAFSTALNMVESSEITLVPLFTAQGYFTQTVIPSEMKLSGTITQQGKLVIRYAPAPVFHPRIQQIVLERVNHAIAQHNLKAQQVSIAIIGHSTRRNPQSREASERQAQLLRETQQFGEVLTAFLDDDPEIPTIYDRAKQNTIIAVPLFLAMGSHTTIDVPNELGLEQGQTSAYIQDKHLIYTPAIGDGNDLTDLILDLAQQVGAPLKTPTPQGAWSNFPRIGWREFQAQLQHTNTLRLGELLITAQGVHHSHDEHPTLTLETPNALRAFVRDELFRPLATAKGLRMGWFAPAKTLDEVCAIIETIYPGALADQTQAPITLSQTLTRQTGMYKELANHDLSTDIENICADCVRVPHWHNPNTDGLSCIEACNWCLSQLLKRIETT
jgi:sirohydrochlorin cobaltochelatase